MPWKSKEARRAHYAANRERMAAQALAYRHANPERTLQKRREYDASHREQLNTKQKKYYQAHHARIRGQVSERYATFREKHRARARLYMYGLTTIDYYVLLERQYYQCAICHNWLDLANQHTHIDHDHYTGKVRGLLCIHCNRLLGSCNDNIDILQSAIGYLR